MLGMQETPQNMKMFPFKLIENLLLRMVVLWLFCGCSMVVLWLFYGCSVVVLWLFYACSMVVLCFS